VETNSGGPTSHLQFLGVIPFSAHIAFCARAKWPLLAAQTRYNGSDVRAWTFGAAASLQYNFRTDRRLRPFLGAGVGTRLGLTEATSTTSLSQSGQTLTTSATLGVEGGVRYSLGPFLQVFLELAAARAFLIPPVDVVNYERAAANGEAAHAAVGLMFES
jgi:outer membrane protein W